MDNIKDYFLNGALPLVNFNKISQTVLDQNGAVMREYQYDASVYKTVLGTVLSLDKFSKIGRTSQGFIKVREEDFSSLMRHPPRQFLQRRTEISNQKRYV